MGRARREDHAGLTNEDAAGTKPAASSFGLGPSRHYYLLSATAGVRRGCTVALVDAKLVLAVVIALSIDRGLLGSNRIVIAGGCGGRRKGSGQCGERTRQGEGRNER